MDGRQFDALTRRFGEGRSRRATLKALVGGIAAVVARGALESHAEAVSCRRAGRACREHANCCSGLCRNGRCACPEGTVSCRGVCRAEESYLSDVDNCGGCGERCRAANGCEQATCVAGVCVREPVACPDQPCQAGSCDPRTGGCAYTPVTCDVRTCQVGACDPKTGGCFYSPQPDDTPCGGAASCCGGVCRLCPTGTTCRNGTCVDDNISNE